MPQRDSSAAGNFLDGAPDLLLLSESPAPEGAFGSFSTSPIFPEGKKGKNLLRYPKPHAVPERLGQKREMEERGPP